MIARFARSAALALVLAVASIAVAHAQTSSDAQAASATTAASGAVSADGSPLAIGWYYFHISVCATYTVGSTIYLYMYATDGSYWWTTNTDFKHILAPACPHTNWVAVYIVNSTTNQWDHTAVYPY